MLKHRALVILAALTLILCAAPALCEASTPMWFGSSDASSPESVGWYTLSGSRYFFLPGCAESRLWFADGSKATIDGDAIENGASAEAYADGKKHKIKVNGKQYNVTILKGSDIPAIFINTASGSLDSIDASKENRESAEMVMLSGGEEFRFGITEMRKRGNSSLGFKKKSFQIKLQDKAELCGMGKAKTWLLISNQIDNSLIRNEITLDMARYAGMDYVPKSQQVDLYINNEYRGLYLLSEKVEIKDSRINIRNLENETEDLNDLPLSEYPMLGTESKKKGSWKAYDIPVSPADITGGYLFELDRTELRYEQAKTAYRTMRKLTVEIKSPKYASKAEMDYITGFIQGFEDAIFSSTGVNESGKAYYEYVDMTSLVRAYLVQEVSKNYDSNTSSLFFYKPSDSESTTAFAGPPWDFNCSWGSYARSHNTAVLKPRGFWANSVTGMSYWWPAIYKHEEFAKAAQERYAAEFKPALEILLGLREEENGMLSLTSYSERIEDSYKMNFTRWGYSTIGGNSASTGKSFKANMEYLTDFIEKRYKFLNENWAE